MGLKRKLARKKTVSGSRREHNTTCNQKIDLGFKYLQEGKTHEAESLFREILTHSPSNSDAHYFLGVLANKKGRFAEAVELLCKATHLNPDNQIYLCNLAVAYKNLPNHAKAVECFRRALRLTSVQKDIAEIHYEIGGLLMMGNKRAEALASYEDALKYGKNNAPLHYNMGNLFKDMERPNEAIQSYLMAINFQPSFFMAHSNLGSIYHGKGELDKSLQYYKQALFYKPGDPRTNNSLGKLYYDMDMKEKARSCFQEALASYPEYPDALNNLGLVLLKQLKIDEAREFIQKAHTLNPQSVEVIYFLAAALFDIKEIDESLDYFQKILSAQPEHPEANTFLAIIAWLDKKWGVCERHLQIVAKCENGLIKDPTFVEPYCGYLNTLLRYKKQHSAQYQSEKQTTTQQTIYAVGDSHCLSIAHTKVHFEGNDFIVKPELVLGCKAWHLANENNNQFKYSFSKKLESIPNGATVFAMFGEIDCRPDTGILKHHLKTNNNLTDSIEKLVGNYVLYLTDTFREKNIVPILCNVPSMSHNKSVPENDRDIQEKIIQTFNNALTRNASKMQIQIIDVYSVSRNSGEGVFLDNRHLLPSVYALLFENL